MDMIDGLRGIKVCLKQQKQNKPKRNALRLFI